MSRVDVIVPCYKYGRYLPQCVESILSQTGVDVRVLVIDDASPDDSATVAAELARKDPRVSFVRHETNHGHIATYNEGIDWVSAEYMLLISADDYLLPGALSRATALMDQDLEISFVFGRALALYGDGTTEAFLTGIAKYDSPTFSVVPSREFIEVSAATNRVPTPTAVVRTSALNRVGGYRPELPHTGDMEMWLRLAACGPVGIIGECQAVYRRHKANMSLGYSRTYLPDFQQRRAALDWFLNYSGTQFSAREALRRHGYLQLAQDAVSQAHRVFGLGEIDTSRQLADFASALCPRIRWSTSWLKLRIKQTLGCKWVGILKGAGLPKRWLRA